MKRTVGHHRYELTKGLIGAHGRRLAGHQLGDSQRSSQNFTGIGA